MRPSALLALLALVLSPGVLAARQTRIVILGAGTPNPEPDRSGPSLAIVSGGRAYIVDAGPGVVRRAQAAFARGVPELAQTNLSIVFLTHLHSDHTIGLPDLLLSPWVLGRTAPLAVYGPPGTADMLRHIEAAWTVDIVRRQDGWQPQNKTGWVADVHEIADGLVYQDSIVRVTAFHVPHGDWPDAFGYRFETRDRVIVVSGDTRASDAVVNACNGCDVLVHEVMSDSALARRTPDWQRYHRYFHTMASELAQIATRAHPGLLVMTHVITSGVSAEALLAEVRRGYAGRAVVANDLEIY